MSAYLLQKEEALLARIAKAKEQLAQLQYKKKLEIGELAYQYGLHQLEPQSLSIEFEKISQLIGDKNG